MGETEKAAETGGKNPGWLGTVTDILFQKSLDRIFTVIGLVMVVLAAIGGIPKFLPLDAVSRPLCGGVGAALMLVGLVIASASGASAARYSVIKRRMGLLILSISVIVALVVIAAFFDLIPLPRTDRLHEMEDMVILGLAVASWFGFIPAYMTASSLANLPEKIDDHLALISKMETKLVSHVEDATRATLDSFAKIFDKAVHLVAHAERELIFVNFAMNFGHPHLLNGNIASEYKSVTGRGFATDVSLFTDRLRAKTSGIDSVHILTVSDEAAQDNFLTLLKNRPGYEKLEIHEESKLMRKAKQDLMDRVAIDMKDVPPPHSKRLRVTDSIPIQMLIAGLPPRDGGSGQRTGCLVLMVGTEILNEGRPGGGFYTELESMVGMFRDLAMALIEDAERHKSNEHVSHSR